jgi:D-glycero-D-manno-heptose 1,7-bisphosphate phosphatase
VGIAEVTKAVFLDRDGVLNRAVIRDGKPHPPATLEQLEVYPDAHTALTRLKEAGYQLIVVTNQPDIARGTQTRAAVDAINAALGSALPIDEFLVCGHDDRDACECRKPKPGLVLAAASAHEINLAQSFLIGDRWRDIDCGAAAGVRTVLIDRHYRERPPSAPPTFIADSLAAAAAWILNPWILNPQSEPRV